MLFNLSRNETFFTVDLHAKPSLSIYESYSLEINIQKWVNFTQIFLNMVRKEAPFPRRCWNPSNIELRLGKNVNGANSFSNRPAAAAVDSRCRLAVNERGWNFVLLASIATAQATKWRTLIAGWFEVLPIVALSSDICTLEKKVVKLIMRKQKLTLHLSMY